jgi:hypothetical protein
LAVVGIPIPKSTCVSSAAGVGAIIYNVKGVVV